MKLRTSIARATIAAAATVAATPNYAQSYVTLFGVADAAIRRTDTQGVGSLTALVSGAGGSSRWGMRGQEDLGGGLTTSFWLEAPINIDTGTTDGFTRRSTVSLDHRDWGEIRVGRDYTPTHWARFDPFGFVGLGSAQVLTLSATTNTPVRAAFGTAPTTIQRVSNSAQYLLPHNSIGVDGGAIYSFKEGGIAANDLHHTVGGRLGYSRGNLYIAGASLRTRNSASSDTFKDTEIAATYQADAVKIYAAVRRYEFRNSRQDTKLLGAVVPLGAHEFKASWVRASMDGYIDTTNIGGNRADQFALGYVYNLSKSTRLYGTWATIHNKGSSRFAILGAPAATANGQSSRGMELGINKAF